MFCASKRIQVVLELEEPPYPEDVDKFEEIPSSEKKSDWRNRLLVQKH